MVKEILRNKQKLFQCEECKLLYKDRKLANKCEKWCKRTNSCNLEIIKYSVKIAD